jgi:uncharacterized protein YbcV (DUF1398 family)
MNRRIGNVIKETTKGSLAGTLSFAEVVGRLIAVGVSYYHVDVARSEQTFYLANGHSKVIDLSLPSEPIAAKFSAAEVAAAVKSSQTEGQSFPDFMARIRKAGCIGYFAYLDGSKVVYVGRLGDEHVEHFPV